MTITSAKTLEQQTRHYWIVSRCWHGVPVGKPLNVQEALKRTSTVLANTNPNRLVARKAFLLQDAIICKPESRKRKA